MKIEDQTCNARDLGRVLSITERRVRQLVEEGVFPRVARGRYPLVECIRAFISAIERRADPEELKRERTRLIKEQADRLERENKVARHEFVDIAAFIDLFSAAGSATRDQLMAMPARRSHEIAAAFGVTPGAVSALLERMIREELLQAAESIGMFFDNFVHQHGDKNEDD